MTEAVASALVEACRKAIRNNAFFEDESDFCSGLSDVLGHGTCFPNQPIAGFDPPIFPPPRPPEGVKFAGDVCETKGKRNRYLDLLWKGEHGSVAIELKYQRRRDWEGTVDGKRKVPRAGWADTKGYEFLKEIHRVERLTAVRMPGGNIVPKHQFSVFLTNEPKEFEGDIPHARLRLLEGTITAGHLVQYNERRADGGPTRPDTLWRDYKPFRLAGNYQISWINLRSGNALGD